MDYEYAHTKFVIFTRTTKMLGVGIAAIALLLVTVPIFKSGVVYADSEDHGDHDDDGDHGDHDDDDDNE